MLAVACVHHPAETDRIIALFATAADRRACARYQRPTRRRQSLAARALLRASFSRLFGCPSESWKIHATADGKPVITISGGREPAQISIAHSRDLVACAISDEGPVGIDVEYCAQGRRIGEIAAATFGPSECAAVDRGGASAFYKIWTLREAMAKVSGVGLMAITSEADLFATAPTGKAWSATVQSRQWIFFYRKLLRDYAVGLALQPALDKRS